MSLATNKNQKRYDLVTIGDSTIDIFLQIKTATVECDIHEQECKICFNYGSKVPVEAIFQGIAGNAANVAVACTKLGLSTTIYTHLGDDDRGKLIKEGLIHAGVAGDYILVHQGRDSNLSVVLTFRSERTIFVYHQSWFYKLPDLPPFSWVYLTSFAESFTNSDIMNEVCRYIDKTRARLVYAPGTYQLKVGVKKYPKILEKCEVLIVNLEEAKNILEVNPHETTSIRDILSKMLMLGPRIVVVTDGQEGSYSSDGQIYLKSGISPTKLVEKTGAGDAYASGLVAGLIHDRSLEEAMIWGTINAAHVIGEIGAQNGLLDYSTMKSHIHKSGLKAARF